MKKPLAALVAILVIGGLVYWFLVKPPGSGPDRELLEAAKSNNIDGIKKAVEGGANVNATLVDSKWVHMTGEPEFEEGYTALHFVVDHSNPDAAAYLLDHGANVNARTKQGRTPLMYAANHLNGAIVKLCLKHGADPSLKDEHQKVAADFTFKRADNDETRGVRFLITGKKETPRDTPKPKVTKGQPKVTGPHGGTTPLPKKA